MQSFAPKGFITVYAIGAETDVEPRKNNNVIGMVLVSHGRLADEFLISLEDVVGPQPNTRTVCIHPDDDMEKCRADIIDCITKTNDGDGVVLLVDMFGITIPSELVFSIMGDFNVEVLSGVNLAMLIRLVNERKTKPLNQAAVSAKEGGRKYINIASKLLLEKTP